MDQKYRLYEGCVAAYDARRPNSGMPVRNLLDPAILFFVFGLIAGALKSNLEVPAPVSRFLSLYLLMALGLKGGFALAQSGLTADVSSSLACAMLLAVVIPLAGFRLLRRFVGGFDAAAIAATYGSVSAVTFVTAVQHLDTQGISYGGHMAAAMALMESPAIVMAVVLAAALRRKASLAGIGVAPGGVAAVQGHAAADAEPWKRTVRDALTDGAQMLLLGSMVVGLLTGDAGKAAMQPFTGDLFKGMLAFFLLDMGLLAARNMGTLRGRPKVLLAYALLAPLVHAALALALALAVDMTAGNATLLAVLAASASYIAVPAALRHAIPEAQPSLYFGMSLGITFPFNILVGIPLYAAAATSLLR